MKSIKKIATWIIWGLLAVIVLGAFPSFASVFAFLIALLILPVGEWQALVGNFLKAKIKIFFIIALTVLMLITFPKSNTQTNTKKSEKSTKESTSSSVISDTESSQTDADDKESTDAETDVDTDTSKENNTDSDEKENTQNDTETNNTPANPEHIHTYSIATCTAPKTCNCGATEGVALGHSWKDATCNSAKKCSVCGATEGAAKGHTYVSGTCSTCSAKDPNYNQITYILNTSSKKFHRTGCSRLPSDNRLDTTMSREEIVNQGYDPCGFCHP